MPIELFETAATRSIMADWVEASVFCTGYPVSSADVTRTGSIRDEPVNGSEYDEEADEYLDAEILDSGAQEVVDSVWRELEYRSRTLGDAYPFEMVTNADGSWLLRSASRERRGAGARSTYLTCLLIAAMRRKILPKAKKDWDPALRDSYDVLKKMAPDVFQRVSYLTGGALIGGTAYWFGWPRPDNTPKLRDALEALVGKIKHAKIKSVDPEWTNSAEKDGTVDLVIWSPFLDGHYGSVVVFGQVASGANWHDKPINAYIKGHFSDWFEDDPSIHYIPAMFMPFMIHEEATPRGALSFEQVARGYARQYERDFGVVLDRMRLTELALRAETRDDSLDEQSMLPAIGRWLARARLYAQKDVSYAQAL